ncbi:MAG: DUF4115 domain-containing protein [Zoogloeaceae bacterium]|jgi:cytoskeleton protein RodZ|nr:DUF4115 domain-containing protein [Zoogloeaceae bacterium]
MIPAAQAGERLRSAREARGWSIPEVAARLRLGERQVEALEAGDCKGLPERTFVRGFVRNYASILDLDPLPLLDLLDQSRDLKAPRLDLPEPMHVVLPLQRQSFRLGSTGLLWVAVGIALFVAAVIIYFLPYDLFPSATRDDTTPEEILPIPGPAGTADGNGPADGDATDGNAADGDPASGNAASASVPEAATPSATASAPPPETLHFRFRRDSWVEVRDRTKAVVAARLFPQGGEGDVSGVPPFTLVIGNAAFVELSFRGAPVALKPGQEGVARLSLP